MPLAWKILQAAVVFGALWAMLHLFGIEKPGRWTALFFVGVAIMAAYGLTWGLSVLRVKLGQHRQPLEPSRQKSPIEHTCRE
jgi:ABC-type polysaccharide/polyol phosphate export permease